MHIRRLIVIAILTLLSLTAALSQEEPSVIEEKLLKNPTSIKLELVPRVLEQNEDPNNLTKPFKAKDKIYFRLQMINTSTLPIEISLTNPYFQNRPDLTKEGQKVSYSKEIAELVKLADQQVDFPHVTSICLEPGEPTVVGQLTLIEWYASPEPGNYELINRFRFVVDGEWIETPPISFEVKP